LESRADLIPIGEFAPDAAATDAHGRTVRLSDFRGKKRIVLVFYPGDSTPVCTAQLCRFRDEWNGFQAQETVVLGVNPWSAAKHRQFAEKYRFPFPLLVDAGGKLAAAFGCRALFGIIRRTVYAIDRQGRVIYAKRGNPDPAELLSILNSTQDTNELKQ
jgi:thioredoxin-dependent peroxiredoxin